MAVRTKQLASGRVSTVGSTTIYTVPAGETAIIKSLALQNLNPTTNVLVSLLADAGAINLTSLEVFNMPASSHQYRDWWIVLPPGADFAINLNTAIGVNYWLSGTELEGVAD